MEAIARVLTSLHYTEEEVESEVSKLAKLLFHCEDNWAALRHEAFSCGVVKALMGVMRSSTRVSLLSKAAGCIALIAHDCDEARSRFSSSDIIPLLLHLCTPRPNPDDAFSEPFWHKEWVPVYEQALMAMRKLTYHNLDHQQKLAQLGGVKLIVDLCTDKEFYAICCQFPPEAKHHLQELTLGKKLICQATPAPREERGSILHSFPAISQENKTLSLQYPAYVVSLATHDQQWIANTMVESGFVWPDHTPFDESARVVWTCMMVTCVEDGGHMWCQFCSESLHPRVQAMCSSLKQLPLPPLSHSPPLPLTEGDVYAVYCDPLVLPSHGCLLVRQWCRARLLGREEDGGVKVFAVDYGFTATVREDQVCPIPQDCRGIPPQAVPCKLLGVAPIPSIAAILENGAAVLRNVAFEKEAYRREIKTFGGIEALLKLSRCPLPPVSQQAVGALLNLAVSEEMRAELGRRGAITTMLALCREHGVQGGDWELLRLSLGCLQNMMLLCPENGARGREEGGGRELMGMLQSGGWDQGMENCIIGVLRNMAGPNQDGISMEEPMSPQQPPYSLSCRGRGPQAHSEGRPRLFRSQQRLQEKRHVNGERVHPMPAYRCLETEGPGGVASRQEVGGESEEETTDGEMLLGEEERAVLLRESSGRITAECYRVSSKLPYTEDSTHEFKNVQDVRRISKKYLKRSICAMINTGKASTIYMGVSRDGTIGGIKISHLERDLLCIEMDGIMRAIIPPIKSHLYQILFVPVAYDNDDSGESPSIAEDYFVVVLELHANPARKVHTIKEIATAQDKSGERFERCYIRFGTSNTQLTVQEMRDMIAFEESGKCGTEMDNIQENIDYARIRVSVDHTTA